MADLHLFDPKRAPYRWEAYSRTAGEFAGDYAEAFPLPPDGLVAILSCNSERGATGASWMILTRSVYRLAAMSGKPPSEALLATHRLLERDAPGITESALCVRVDFSAMRLVSACAGDVHGFVARGDRTVDAIPGTPFPLGASHSMEGVRDTETGWSPGDLILLCGAGCRDIEGPSKEPFGLMRLSEAIASAPRTAKEMIAWVAEAIDRHAGLASRTHDVSLLAVELGDAR